MMLKYSKLFPRSRSAFFSRLQNRRERVSRWVALPCRSGGGAAGSGHPHAHRVTIRRRETPSEAKKETTCWQSTLGRNASEADLVDPNLTERCTSSS